LFTKIIPATVTPRKKSSEANRPAGAETGFGSAMRRSYQRPVARSSR
jgi:hypothetical protein